MGRKVHPYGFRLGYIKDWRSKWFAADKKCVQRIARRRYESAQAGYEQSWTRRHRRYPHRTIPKSTWRFLCTPPNPGIIIGRKGQSVIQLRKDLEDLTKKKIKLDVVEVEMPDADAYLIAESICQQMEKRISHKRAMKQAVMRAMRGGAQGIKITAGGRLAGSEMARREMVKDGRIPLNTLRADIDYARHEALTTYGKIGVKVWIYKGEVLPDVRRAEIAKQIQAAAAQAEAASENS